MDPTDTKRVLMVIAAAFFPLVETCGVNKFQLEGSLCCPYCPEGMYVAKNCSRHENKRSGVTCYLCRVCEEYGQRTVSNCTKFSDTQCADSVSEYDSGGLKLTLSCAAIVMGAVLLILVAVCSCCRISTSEETSARKPFITEDNEKVNTIQTVISI